MRQLIKEAHLAWETCRLPFTPPYRKHSAKTYSCLSNHSIISIIVLQTREVEAGLDLAPDRDRGEDQAGDPDHIQLEDPAPGQALLREVVLILLREVAQDQLREVAQGQLRGIEAGLDHDHVSAHSHLNAHDPDQQRDRVPDLKREMEMPHHQQREGRRDHLNRGERVQHHERDPTVKVLHSVRDPAVQVVIETEKNHIKYSNHFIIINAYACN